LIQYTVVILLILSIVLLIILSFRRREGGTVEYLHQDVNSLRREMSEHLSNITQQFQSASGQMGDVRHHLGVLERAAEQILDVGKNISTLQEILQAPKLRGGFGEYLLGDLLSQLLPRECFKLQHQFRSSTVDAVISLGDRFIPIDAKFPLENFRRLREAHAEAEERLYRRRFLSDVKKHVDTIAEKYIVPDEGTYQFALMYIPAENVYYETIVKYDSPEGETSIVDHALGKKVIPVSPNTLYAYLQVIALGLRGLRIDQHAQEILAHLDRLQGDFEHFKRDFEVVGSHLDNARNRYEDACRKLSRLEDQLTGLEDSDETIR